MELLSPIVLAVLVGYVAFSIWNAYSAGVSRGMMRKQSIKGIAQHGPSLSLILSFAGIALAVFLLYELAAYYSGFIRINLPAALDNLDFITFLTRQFETINFRSERYVAFLGAGLSVSLIAALVLVKFLYEKGIEHSGS